MSFKVIECPRDAMQGLSHIISTEKKVEYLRLLLDVGFDTLDFGSFVSPKAVPQMADTADILKEISKEAERSSTKLLAIIANVRGAEDALKFPEIDFLGYPLSVSETFQQRNTGKSIGESIEIVRTIQEMCKTHQKSLVVYLSMGFGNPYNDPYNSSIVIEVTETLSKMGVQIISLSDTVGLAQEKDIELLLSDVVKRFPEIEIGAHLHSHPETVSNKVTAVVNSGCRRIDTAILGYGGCPFAEDTLIGNLDTQTVIQSLIENGISTEVSVEKLSGAGNYASGIF